MRTLTLLLLVLAPALARADVRIVSPAGPFTQIQSAVDAAQDGDLLLVKSGTYASFVVSGKSLTIVGDTGNTVSVNGAARVRNLTSGQVVSIIRISAWGNLSLGGTGPYGLYLSNNLGTVRCESCGFAGASGIWPHRDGYDGVYVQNCADVALVRCTLGGGGGSDGYVPDVGTGGAALHAVGSTITLYDTTAHGGHGLDCFTDGDGGNGGSSAIASACTVFASRCAFQGGQGGNAGGFSGFPGYGGFGVSLISGSLMRLLECSTHGGTDGFPQSGGIIFEPDRVGTTFIDLAGQGRTMSCTNPVRELTTLQLTLYGAAGERVYLLASTEPTLRWRPAWSGNLLVAAHAPHLMLLVGTTDASGDLVASIAIDDLGVNVQSRTLFLQPLFEDASGQRRLGTPITLAELDQAF